MWTTLCFFVWALTASLSLGFVPGLKSKTYKVGDPIEIKVNGLTSVKSQVPFNYYHLPFCRPNVITSHVESLGEIIMGETVENSDYVASFLKPTTCQKLCQTTLTEAQIKQFKQLIEDEYTAEWIADGLPALFPHPIADGNGVTEWYSLGYPIGWKQNNFINSKDAYFIYNYVSIIFKYRVVDDDKFASKSSKAENREYQIVGFEVVPISYHNPAQLGITSSYCEPLNVSNNTSFTPVEQSFFLRQYIPSNSFVDLDTSSPITFIYDVKFQETHIEYAQRWDTYLLSQRSGMGAAAMEVHWFSIVNSLVVVLVLSGIVAMILVRTLHRDIARYNELVLNAEDESEESGWKLVHGDVLRKPQHSTILAALAGSGVQILSMLLVTLIIATIGVGLNPATGFGRGRLLQLALLLWSVMGIIGGYTAARFYKLFQSPNWKMTTIRTALMYPGVVFSISLVVNVAMWISSSSAAVPFGTIFLIVLIWFGISTPLIFVGAYFGFRQPAISLPVRVNKIPRQVPAQPWTVHPLLTCIAGGTLPFGAVFTELMFVFSSLWQHKTYMLFGLLLLVSLILIITCAEIAITMVYFQLVCEDYYWWWRSFFVPASSGLFVFIYSIIYASTRLSLSRVTSVILYLGYSLIISYTFAILTGSIGFIASFLFVRAIYGSIRVD